MKRAYSILFLAGCVASIAAGATPWHFAVFGDSRGRDHLGVSTEIIFQISRKIVDLNSSEPCSAVVFVGDLVRGQIEDASNTYLSAMYSAARGALAPLYDSRIPFFPCRGNHETYWNPVLLTNTPPDQAWREAFSNDVPANGPSNELYMTYSFVTNNALFVSMDQYNGNSNDSEYHLMASLPWMTNVLAANTNPFVFVYGHEPAFDVNSATDTDGVVESGLTTHLSDRDEFWNDLGQGRVSAYFTGHIHLLSLGEATDFTAHVVAHMVAGNGGAPADPYNGRVVESNRLTQLYYASQTFGFVWVTVGGPTYNLTSYELNTNDYSWRVGYTYTPVAVHAVGLGPAPGTMSLTFNAAVGAGHVVRAYTNVNGMADPSGGTNLWQATIAQPGLLTNILFSLPAGWPRGFISIDSQ